MTGIVKMSDAGGMLNTLPRYNSMLAGNMSYVLPLPTGRVAYYPGIVTSGNLVNRLGTAGTGTSIAQVTGTQGSAVSFGGSSFVNLNFATTPAALTWAFWIKAPSPASSGQIINNVAYFADSTTNFPFQITANANGTISAVLSKGNDYQSDGLVSSATGVCDNTWHFVAVTYTANSAVRIYVDGALSASIAIDFSFSTSAYNWHLGRDAFPYSGGLPGRFLTGSLDEISYYERELSLSEVQALMTQMEA